MLQKYEYWDERYNWTHISLSYLIFSFIIPVNIYIFKFKLNYIKLITNNLTQFIHIVQYHEVFVLCLRISNPVAIDIIPSNSVSGFLTAQALDVLAQFSK